MVRHTTRGTVCSAQESSLLPYSLPCYDVTPCKAPNCWFLLVFPGSEGHLDLITGVHQNIVLQKSVMWKVLFYLHQLQSGRAFLHFPGSELILGFDKAFTAAFGFLSNPASV